MSNKEEYTLKEGLPKLLTRWWLRSRPCKSAVQLNVGEGIPSCIEFYVPWWGWGFELTHRLIFGKSTLDK